MRRSRTGSGYAIGPMGLAARLRPSMGDFESAELARRRRPGDLHVENARRRRSPAAPADEIFDGRAGAFDQCLHRPVGKVAHLADEPEPLALVLRTGPVRDALHPSRDRQPCPDRLFHARSANNARKAFSSTIRTPSSFALFSLLPASSPATRTPSRS